MAILKVLSFLLSITLLNSLSVPCSNPTPTPNPKLNPNPNP